MIITKIDNTTKIDIDRLDAYMHDADHAGPGSQYGPKADPDGFFGLNFVSLDRQDQVREMKILSAGCDSTSPGIIQHWVFSWPRDERPTQEQRYDAAKQFLKDQGLEGHLTLAGGHTDTDYIHTHVAVCRADPTPDATGKHRLIWDRGEVTTTSKGQTHVNQYLSAQVTVAKCCARYGWRELDGRFYSWKDGQLIRAREDKRASDIDKIRLGVRVERQEAKTGEKHPKRILAEQSVEILRNTSKDKDKAIAALAAAKITYKDEDYTDNKGRHHKGGVLISAENDKIKVKISSLPKDTHWITKGEGYISPVSPISTELSKNKQKPPKTQETQSPNRRAAWAEKQDALRRDALPIVAAHAAQGWQATQKALAAKKIRLSEEPAKIRDQKTGQERAIVYARLERDNVSVSLKSLAVDDRGKALFRARELQQIQLAQDAARIFDREASWKNAETAMAAEDIQHRRVKITIDNKDIIISRLQRGDVITTTGKAGPEYTPSKLDARYMPYDQAREHYLDARQQAAPVKYLAGQGLTASDIDRIGRVGERIERDRQPVQTPAPTPSPQPKAQSGKSVIPQSMNEIMDEILRAAEETAARVRLQAERNRAIYEANEARRREQDARRALEELRESIQYERELKDRKDTEGIPPAAPTPVAANEQPAQQAEEEKESSMSRQTPTRQTDGQAAAAFVDAETQRREEDRREAERREAEEWEAAQEREREIWREAEREREREREREIELEREREAEREAERERM